MTLGVDAGKSSASEAKVEDRLGKSRASTAHLSVFAGVILAILLAWAARDIDGLDLDDPRNVMLEQTVVIGPDKTWLEGDHIAGIRPGQAKDDALRRFRSAYWGSPHERNTIVVRGDIRSQFFVNEFWDVDDNHDRLSIAKVNLSSPSTGNVVLSTMRNDEYKGRQGYPSTSDVEAALVRKFGPPSSRQESFSGDTFSLIWIRGEGSCASGCQFAYSDPTNGNGKDLTGKALTEMGYPLRPVIVAEIERREHNRERVAAITVRMTDYRMIALTTEADATTMDKAQAAFDALPGPEVPF